MKLSEYLVARGWREDGSGKPERWWPPTCLEVGLPVPHDERTAAEVQRKVDVKDVTTHGSVKFVATKEQETSPLLAALGRGRWTERDAIDRLFRESEARAAQMATLTKMSPRDAVALGNAAAITVERDAWRTYALTFRLSGTSAMNARRKALAALRALGIDPEAP